MSYYILCTPNISEGRNKEVIETCAAAISSVDGVLLLDVDSSHTNNRTIFNFVGNSLSIIEAALNLCRAAYNLIDISKHKGYQPRIGVISACPFVPLRNEDIDKCIEVAQEFAKLLAEEVMAPIYIYGESVTDDARRMMIEELFSTEYEELKDKLQKDELQPDHGVAEFVPQWGATLVGARKFLVYFNVNMIGTKEQAVHVGNKLEEKYNDGGNKKEEVQCAGWFSDELNIAQVSINIINFEKTPVYEVYEYASQIAKEANSTVIGSQLVGAVPLSLVTQTANHIMEKDDLLILDEDQKIRLVIGKLSLNTITTFNPKEKIIEYIIEANEDSGTSAAGSSTISLENALLNLSLTDFIQAVAARNSTPGLGSVSSLVALMGTSLATMNGLLSYGRCQDSDKTQNPILRKTIPQIYQVHRDLMPFIDRHALLAFEYSKVSNIQIEPSKDQSLKKELEDKSIERCLECPKEAAENLSKIWQPMIETLPVLDESKKAELKMAAKFILVAMEGLLSLVKTYPKESNEKVIGEIEKLVKDGQEQLQKIE